MKLKLVSPVSWTTSQPELREIGGSSNVSPSLTWVLQFPEFIGFELLCLQEKPGHGFNFIAKNAHLEFVRFAKNLVDARQAIGQIVAYK